MSKGSHSIPPAGGKTTVLMCLPAGEKSNTNFTKMLLTVSCAFIPQLVEIKKRSLSSPCS